MSDERWYAVSWDEEGEYWCWVVDAAGGVLVLGLDGMPGLGCWQILEFEQEHAREWAGPAAEQQ